MVFKYLYSLMNRYPALISYTLFVVLLNTIFSYVPEVHIFHQSLSIADFIVGFIYVFRDFAQREAKHWVILAMVAGCAISYVLAEKTVALASLGAFAVGETIDWIIFTFTKKPLSQRVLYSSFISSPIDTIVNLYLLTQLNWLGFVVMTIVKFLGVFSLWALWCLRRAKLMPLVSDSSLIQ